MFDEFTNDFLYLREGSCFPRYLFDHICVYIASAKPTSSANITTHHVVLIHLAVELPTVRFNLVGFKLDMNSMFDPMT